MNKTAIFSACIAAASVLMPLACTPEATPVKYTLPEVDFTMDEKNISAQVGETVHFTAKLVSGDKVSTAWYINDVIESSAQSFDYIFTEPGFYNVRFEAKNGAGTVSESYSVTVSDLLSVSLSIKDSTEIERLQYTLLKVAAIVESGSDIEHRWMVNDVVACEKPFFNTLTLNESSGYTIRYSATNSAGTFNREFRIKVLERPLEITFNQTDPVIKVVAGGAVSFEATVVHGSTGIRHSWSVDDVETATSANFTYLATVGGAHTVSYYGVNGKGEEVKRSWTVNVDVPGDCFDDFEGITSLKNIWGNGNEPGIQLADNPAKDDVNPSDKCMSDEVNGSGGTSGYFNLKFSNLASSFDLPSYKKLRFKVHFNGNKYYPRVDIGGTKYPPVTAPKFNGGWEVLEYDLPSPLSATSTITIRPLLQENGSNISGRDPVTNNRKMYFDDFELVK